MRDTKEGMRFVHRGVAACCGALVALALSIGFVAADSTSALADEVVGTPATSEDAGIAAQANEQVGTFNVTGTSNQTEARKILPMVNAARSKAPQPANALTWDYNLEKAAIQRAAELSVYFDHARPNGQGCFTAISGAYNTMGENIYASTGVSNATTANTAWTNSTGHHANMVNAGFTCMGAAMFTANGATYWVELFGSPNRAATATAAVDGSRTYAIQVVPSVANLSFTATLPDNAKVGASATYAVVNTNRGWSASRVVVNNNSFNWTSSNTGLATVNGNGAVTVKGAGSVTITAACKNLASIKVARTTTTVKASSANTTQTTVKAGWVKSGSRWWYRYSDGSYPKSCSKVIGGQTYRFDGAGWMRTGWVKENNKWYYHNASGAMVKGWALVGRTWYYLNPSDGVMKTGWYNVGSKRYYSDGSGAMKTGWVHSGNKWYWMDGSGAMHKGWALVGGRTWYYLNPSDGVMKTGWYNVGSSRYYSDGSGAMRTGWVKSGNNWYYMNASGAMVKGWALVGGRTWYYLNPSDGVMKTGFYDVAGKRYYSDASGAMKTGWVLTGSKWYWMDGSGAMAKNRWISGIYWVGSDGVMAKNAHVDNGRYYVNANGVWTVFWAKSGDKFHLSRDCTGLNNASSVNSGMASAAAQAGHASLCATCQKTLYN